jgi:predicted Zn-dependent peptidase
MKRLQEELVSEEELEVLRNYLIGQLINKFSSPFDTIDQFKAVYQSGMDFSYYDKRWKLLQSFTAEDILHTSRCYLRNEACIEVSVG